MKPTITYVADDTSPAVLENVVLIAPAEGTIGYTLIVIGSGGRRMMEHAASDLSQAVVGAVQIAAFQRSAGRGHYVIDALASLEPAIEKAAAEGFPKRKSDKPTTVERRPRPGADARSRDSERYVFDAVDPIADAWAWDDPEHRAALSRELDADQLAVFAVWMVDGEIDNGGVAQAIWNSAGELCEAAVGGFRHVGRPEQGALFDEMLSRFERPIPEARSARQDMLWRVADLTPAFDDLGLPDRAAVSELYKRCGARVKDLETRYFAIERQQTPLLDVLARFIDTRWQNFFR